MSTWQWIREHPYVVVPLAVAVLVMCNGIRKGKARFPTEREICYLLISAAGACGAFRIFADLCVSKMEGTDMRPWAMSIGGALMMIISFRVIADIALCLWRGCPEDQFLVAPKRRQGTEAGHGSDEHDTK